MNVLIRVYTIVWEMIVQERIDCVTTVEGIMVIHCCCFSLSLAKNCSGRVKEMLPRFSLLYFSLSHILWDFIDLVSFN